MCHINLQLVLQNNHNLRNVCKFLYSAAVLIIFYSKKLFSVTCNHAFKLIIKSIKVLMHFAQLSYVIAKNDKFANVKSSTNSFFFSTTILYIGIMTKEQFTYSVKLLKKTKTIHSLYKFLYSTNIFIFNLKKKITFVCDFLHNLQITSFIFRLFFEGGPSCFFLNPKYFHTDDLGHPVQG